MYKIYVCLQKIILLLSFCLCLSTVQAANSDPTMDEIIEMPLEQLMALDINTSVSKKEQSVKDSAAAIFVISQDDIHRSGATNVPDVLRRVPGMEVAQVNSSTWAISVRGFNQQFATKLLVMIDGRTVYSPIFSGVYWHREDTPLEDVERIEVIRGAGAAIWGANAVNGVINIITKKARDTQGTLLTAGSGNQENGFGSARHGGKIGDDFFYRVYAKGFQRDNNITIDNKDAQDDWESYQGGFKSEWRLSDQDSLSTQGDIFHSRTGNMQKIPTPVAPFEINNVDSTGLHDGGNMQTVWQHKISEDSETTLQLYYSHYDSTWSFMDSHRLKEQTVNIDFQHRFKLFENHDLLWGLVYRYFDFRSYNESFKFALTPSNKNLNLFSGFLQDDISLIEDELKLTLGVRFDKNNFTGFELQPNIRMIWTPNSTHSVWAAISRAVQIPSMSDTGTRYRLLEGPSSIVTVRGNPDYRPESVLAYELGYRTRITPTLYVDVTAFYNQHHDLYIAQVLDTETVQNNTGTYYDTAVLFTNNAHGETLGVELTSEWQVNDSLKLQASYSLLQEDRMRLTETPAYRSPHQRVYAQASLDLPFDIQLDAMMRYVDSDPNYTIDHYTAFDMRAAWKPIKNLKNLEFSIVGQNLFDDRHQEMRADAFQAPRTEIQRSVYGKVSLSF